MASPIPISPMIHKLSQQPDRPQSNLANSCAASPLGADESLSETASSVSSVAASPDSMRRQQDADQKTESDDKDALTPSVAFQADFLRRIVRDVEDNLREVLRCRFGDLIIQSAQQFLTIQVVVCFDALYYYLPT